MQRVYDVPIDILLEIEADSDVLAVTAVQQFRHQLPDLFKYILIRYQVVSTDFALFEESVREIPQPDIRFRRFSLDAHLALAVQADDLTMVSELAIDFCEDIDIRFGPTFSQLKIRKYVMDIGYDRIAQQSGPAAFEA